MYQLTQTSQDRGSLARSRSVAIGPAAFGGCAPKPAAQLSAAACSRACCRRRRARRRRSRRAGWRRPRPRALPPPGAAHGPRRGMGLGARAPWWKPQDLADAGTARSFCADSQFRETRVVRGWTHLPKADRWASLSSMQISVDIQASFDNAPTGRAALCRRARRPERRSNDVGALAWRHAR